MLLREILHDDRVSVDDVAVVLIILLNHVRHSTCWQAEDNQNMVG